jgi:RecG-like helicase
VPAAVLARHDLVDRTSAIRGFHLPQSMGDVSAARRRLVFDELLRVQVALVDRKRELERTSVGYRTASTGRWSAPSSRAPVHAHRRPAARDR